MKTGLSMFLCCALLVFSSPSLLAEVVGDVDNDGKVGIPEAINALGITAGLKTHTTAPIPNLLGKYVATSPMKCFSYENFLLPNQMPEYFTSVGVSITITTQNGEVFAGYSVGPDHDPDEAPAYLAGIVLNNRITIQMATNNVWHRINAVLNLTGGQQKLVGTFEQFENQATASRPGILSCTFEAVKQ